MSFAAFIPYLCAWLVITVLISLVHNDWSSADSTYKDEPELNTPWWTAPVLSAFAVLIIYWTGIK